MIVGPGDSPYEGAYFFFDVDFPSSYPLEPPKVIFKTGDGGVRLHPNLYETKGGPEYYGKVCLSILGTWSGEKWTSSCSLRTVLLEIFLKVTDANNLERKRAQEQQALLISELNHPVRADFVTR